MDGRCLGRCGDQWPFPFRPDRGRACKEGNVRFGIRCGRAFVLIPWDISGPEWLGLRPPLCRRDVLVLFINCGIAIECFSDFYGRTEVSMAIWKV